MSKRQPVKNRRSTGRGRAATQFKKGQSGNPKGRPKGSKNYNSTEWAKLCREAASQVDALEWLVKRMRKGTLKPELLKRVWEYAFGRPPQAIDLSVDFDPREYLSRPEKARDD